MSDDQAIANAYAEYEARRQDLEVIVQSCCPTPDGHMPLQHRDGKPPWCDNCGRTWDGRKGEQ